MTKHSPFSTLKPVLKLHGLPLWSGKGAMGAGCEVVLRLMHKIRIGLRQHF